MSLEACRVGDKDVYSRVRLGLADMCHCQTGSAERISRDLALSSPGVQLAEPLVTAERNALS